VSQPTRAEFQRLLASGELFERYAQMENELDTERLRLLRIACLFNLYANDATTAAETLSGIGEALGPPF
jgi:hypothetical protein